GLGLQWLRRHRYQTLWPALAVTASVIVVSDASLRRVAWDFLEVARHPESYYWHGEEWACHGAETFCDPLDASAAIRLRSLTTKGDVILTNVSSVPIAAPKRQVRRDIRFHTILSALSQAFVTGHGIRVSQDGRVAMGLEYRKSQGFRAIAFWHTIDTSLLRDMS